MQDGAHVPIDLLVRDNQHVEVLRLAFQDFVSQDSLQREADWADPFLISTRVPSCPEARKCDGRVLAVATRSYES